MKVTLQKIQCWDPGSGFNVFLDTSAEIDLTALSASKVHYVQVGPYRVKIEVEGKGDGTKALLVGGTKIMVGGGDAVSGSVFLFLDAGVEKVSMDGKYTSLGSASGCFEVHW